MGVLVSVRTFTRDGIEDDSRKLAQYGVGPLSQEAAIFYAKWTREDLIGVFYLIERLTWVVGVLLVAIAVPLWMMALR